MLLTQIILSWFGKSQSDFELNIKYKSHINLELNFDESQNDSKLNNEIAYSYHKTQQAQLIVITVNFIICLMLSEFSKIGRPYFIKR
jgi:hypothetical protein